MVDILDDELHARADELRQQFGVEVRTAICDVGAPAPYKALEDAVGGLDVDVLVCNHMFTPTDTPPILDTPLEIHSRMIDINARPTPTSFTASVVRCATAAGGRSSSSHSA